MQRCWHEDPNERPDFGQIKKVVEKFNKYALYCQFSSMLHVKSNPLHLYIQRHFELLFALVDSRALALYR